MVDIASISGFGGGEEKMSAESVLLEIGEIAGLTPAIVRAIWKAELDPSSDNLNAVVAAYAQIGRVAPVKLMSYFIEQNKQRYPGSPYIQETVKSALPYLVIGGLILFLVFRGKR